MDGPVELAASMDSAAQTMARVGAALAGLDPGAAALSGAAAGRPGEAGRALHAQLVRAIGARSQEAAVAGARLSDAAQALRWAAAGYLDTDDATRQRVTGARGQVALPSAPTRQPGQVT